jgi:hypothetical protein
MTPATNFGRQLADGNYEKIISRIGTSTGAASRRLKPTDEINPVIKSFVKERLLAPLGPIGERGWWDQHVDSPFAFQTALQHRAADGSSCPNRRPVCNSSMPHALTSLACPVMSAACPGVAAAKYASEMGASDTVKHELGSNTHTSSKAFFLVSHANCVHPCEAVVVT